MTMGAMAFMCAANALTLPALAMASKVKHATYTCDKRSTALLQTVAPQAVAMTLLIK